jgi:hypothetical protein
MNASAHGSRPTLHFEPEGALHTPQQDQPGLFRSHPN